MILQVIIFSFAILSARFGYKKVLRLKAIQITQINQIPRLQAESTSIESGEKLPIKPETSNVIAIGNTQSIKHDHPTIDLVLKRWREGSKPGHRLHGDIQKLALAIEGGGMRGCVAAGATAAIHFLGLNDAIDVVYGSSAGAMVAAYFVARQFSGVQIYHDILPRAGKRFIDKNKLLAAIGLPRWLVRLLFFIRIKSPWADITESRGRRKAASDDVFNLDFLLNEVMHSSQSLDWSTFERNEKFQPLRIIACSTRQLQTVSLSRDDGNYCDLLSLLACIRASMTVPGVTGPMMAMPSPSTASVEHRTGDSNVEIQNKDAVTITQSRETRDKFMRIPFPIWVAKDGSVNAMATINHDNINSNVYSVKSNNCSIDSSSIESLGLKNRILAYFRTKDKVRFVWLAVVLRALKPLQSLTSSPWSMSSYHRSHHHRNRRVSKREPAMDLPMSVAEENTLSVADTVNPVSMLTASQKEFKKFINPPRGSPATSNVNIQGGSEKSVYEGLVDACICEPMPYRQAVLDGASHVIVLRTKPDSCQAPLTGAKPGVFEKFIAKRFFNKYREKAACDWVLNMQHIKIYAEDILYLNEGALGAENGVNVKGRNVHILPVAASPSSIEVGQLDQDRELVLSGMRDGALRVFELFAPQMRLPDDIKPSDLVDMVFPLSLLLTPSSDIQDETDVIATKTFGAHF